MRAWLSVAGLICLLAPFVLSAQNRDLHTERLVLDDNGSAGGPNTMTVQVDPALTSDVVVTIPVPTSSPSQFLLAPPGSTGAWLLNGNAGTTFGADFIGTSDGVALQIGVNSGGDNSLILNADGSIQRDAGGDARGARAVDLQIDRDLATQVASGSYSAIGGGTRNSANGDNSVVGGGYENSAVQDWSTVGGGRSNYALRQYSTVAGGVYDSAFGYASTIGGGLGNKTYSSYSAIPGGIGLTLGPAAAGSFGFLGGDALADSMTINNTNIAVFGNTDLWLANNDNAASALRFYEANAVTGAFPGATNYTSFVAGTQSADIRYVLPVNAPTGGQVLHSDASGNLNWAPAGTSGVVFNRVTTNAAASPYTAPATAGIIGVDVSGGPVIVNLPDADLLTSGCVVIVNVEAGDAGTNTVTINAAAGDTFDGTGAAALTITFAQGQFRFYSDGVNGWYTY